MDPDATLTCLTGLAKRSRLVDCGEGELHLDRSDTFFRIVIFNRCTESITYRRQGGSLGVFYIYVLFARIVV